MLKAPLLDINIIFGNTHIKQLSYVTIISYTSYVLNI